MIMFFVLSRRTHLFYNVGDRIEIEVVDAVLFVKFDTEEVPGQRFPGTVVIRLFGGERCCHSPQNTVISGK